MPCAPRIGAGGPAQTINSTVDYVDKQINAIGTSVDPTSPEGLQIDRIHATDFIAWRDAGVAMGDAAPAAQYTDWSRAGDALIARVQLLTGKWVESSPGRQIKKFVTKGWGWKGVLVVGIVGAGALWWIFGGPKRE